jgi:hypothetical protein
MNNEPTEADGQTETDKLKFDNRAPDDKEWSAHIELLNEWTEQTNILRGIIQYARSGPFYPADMHVDLIKQIISWETEQVLNKLEDYIGAHEADTSSGERIAAELKKLIKENKNVH